MSNLRILPDIPYSNYATCHHMIYCQRQAMLIKTVFLQNHNTPGLRNDQRVGGNKQAKTQLLLRKANCNILLLDYMNKYHSVKEQR